MNFGNSRPKTCVQNTDFANRPLKPTCRQTQNQQAEGARKDATN
ncbi:hypothetical protein ASZ86_03125 [Vibrio cholerae]|nr:hypothetical protein ASZ86_03125 [Vibrio cholerae]